MSKPNPVTGEVSSFDQGKLKHVEPQEKAVLPTAEDVHKEKVEVDLMHEIEKGAPLKKVETVEKNPLPTKEDIAQEKKAH